MEIAESNKLQFLGIMIEKKDCELVTSLYRKPTNNGLLLHFQSHVDMRYKKSLIKTMLHRAYRLSSSWESVVRECEEYLKGMFFQLGYPDRLVDATVTSSPNSAFVDKDQVQNNNALSEGNIVRVILPFKDQRSADSVRKQLKKSWQQHRKSSTNGFHESKTWRATSNSGDETTRRQPAIGTLRYGTARL